MTYKIVSDSASNLLSMDGDFPYSTVPLHIIVGNQTFTDNEQLDTNQMYEALAAHKGKTSTSCPSPEDWINAFDNADAVFCVTITSGLSGSYASAHAAKQMYEEKYPDRVVYLVDSLSTGPEMVLLIEKLKEMIEKEMAPSAIYEAILAYHKSIHLYYALASLDNLARNGRISLIIAKGIGVLGIRVIGTTTAEGTLKPVDKARGDNKSVPKLLSYLKSSGYNGGKIIISHSNNLETAQELKAQIEAIYGPVQGYIHDNTGLCSYYAENHSVLIGFET